MPKLIKLLVVKDAECSDCIGSCCSTIYRSQAFKEEEFPCIAKHLGISVDLLKKDYVEPEPLTSFYKARSINNMCSFYKDGCIINSLKPYECKAYEMNKGECRLLFVSKKGHVLPSYNPEVVRDRVEKNGCSQSFKVRFGKAISWLNNKVRQKKKWAVLNGR
jgi:hypothetical protein